MNWYIGQPIVAVKNHSTGCFKKNDEFKINGIRRSPCGCNKVQLDIGIPNTTGGVICAKCGSPSLTKESWMHDISFAPLDQDISELTEILTTKQPFEV